MGSLLAPVDWTTACVDGCPWASTCGALFLTDHFCYSDCWPGPHIICILFLFGLQVCSGFTFFLFGAGARREFSKYYYSRYNKTTYISLPTNFRIIQAEQKPTKNCFRITKSCDDFGNMYLKKNNQTTVLINLHKNLYTKTEQQFN